MGLLLTSFYTLGERKFRITDFETFGLCGCIGFVEISTIFEVSLVSILI
ncbi:hypothetical protein BIFDEN_00205 [Bifidobacterium dentium ATCC 27678]|nr:hypothetical protein BIFDEN_00205 [Bifidobacterium dentium ATCC 27678]